MAELYERYAELYDLAFSWDIEDEVDWRVQLQMGGEAHSSRWETDEVRVTWTTERTS